MQRRIPSESVVWFEHLSVGDISRVGGKNAVKVGICGQAPSNHPEFAAFLVEAGIDSISLNPDSFVATTRRVAETERMQLRASGT